MRLWRKSEEITGFLDHGTDLTGELQFSGTLRIDGNFRGTITNGDTLAIGENARVHADIKVGEVEIYGNVVGNIEVARRIEIFPTGRLRGDLVAPVLVVHEGGVFDGHSRMPSSNADEESPILVQHSASAQMQTP
jgi:cytoskeletal protein CcmA (bactofilin family)